MYFHISVPDTERAMAFYGTVFGWSFDSSGDYHHVAGSSPAGGIAKGDEPGITPAFVVGDIHKAVKAATTATEPVRSRSGWSATVEDGHVEVWQPAEGFHDPNPRGGVGDVFYYVVPVADDAAKDVYAAVFGWEFTPGSHPGGWNIVNTPTPGGLFVGGEGAPDLYFRVEDVDAAAVTIRDAGGTVGDVQPNSKGWHAACTDDQGVGFSIGALRD